MMLFLLVLISDSLLHGIITDSFDIMFNKKATYLLTYLSNTYETSIKIMI